MFKKILAQKTNLYLGLICLIGVIVSIYYFPSDFNREDTYVCEVMETIQTSGGYKSAAKFIVVLKDIKTGKMFDISVTPTLYYKAKNSKYLHLSLTREEITKDYSTNNRGALCVLGVIVFGLCAFGFFYTLYVRICY